MDILIQELIKFGFMILGVIWTMVVLPRIQEWYQKLKANKDNELLVSLADTAVSYVEMKMRGYDGAEKKAFAMRALASLMAKYNIHVTQEDMDKYIESAVLGLQWNKCSE